MYIYIYVCTCTVCRKYIRCTYGIFGIWDFIKYTVIYGAHIRLTDPSHTVYELTDPSHSACPYHTSLQPPCGPLEVLCIGVCT